MSDVIVNTEFGLDEEQLAVLEGYANGLDEFDIRQVLELTPAELKTIELDVRARLNANTTPHMISRAWQLGVLASRALCLVLVMVTSFHALDPDMTRVRTPMRNTRNPTTIARVRQAGRNKEI
ncbi:hypothetical protein NAL94_23770 (plasmid) [Vibrio alginolyticus]|uniref:hypothetical protein n=1 Tax=Vibrio TaxID=662 RepID=UPI0014828BE6|nr:MULTISPECIES: hypothetical protein [Vibrio]NNN82175.1 hypothetical protein [Vibrio sp. 11-4(1)]URR30135.1 hypothetical protein NAL94_23770 [Vibrio alginolyticus]